MEQIKKDYKKELTKVYFSKYGLMYAFVFMLLCIFTIGKDLESIISTAILAIVSLSMLLTKTNMIKINEKSIAIKGLLPKDNYGFNWDCIKQVKNDYPRIIISNLSFAKEESEFQKAIERGESGPDHLEFSIKHIFKGKDLLREILIRSKDAKIDDGIYKMFDVGI